MPSSGPQPRDFRIPLGPLVSSQCSDEEEEEGRMLFWTPYTRTSGLAARHRHVVTGTTVSLASWIREEEEGREVEEGGEGGLCLVASVRERRERYNCPTCAQR